MSYFWQDRVGNPTDIGARYRLWLPSYPANPDSTGAGLGRMQTPLPG